MSPTRPSAAVASATRTIADRRAPVLPPSASAAPAVPADSTDLSSRPRPRGRGGPARPRPTAADASRPPAVEADAERTASGPRAQAPRGLATVAQDRRARRRRAARRRVAPACRVPKALAIVRAPKHRLLVVCTAVLATGMLCVLLLNTIISQGAFRQHELELALIHASESEERLSRQVQLAEAPHRGGAPARELGMVPAAAPVFLRLSDGAVLGDPVPAPRLRAR